MRPISAESALAKVRQYLTSDISTPYFIVVDDSDEYDDILNGIGTLSQLRVSDFCATDDSYPDIDALSGAVSTVIGNTILLGFGEYVSLSGNINVVGKFKDLQTSAKVVIVCRSIRGIINRLCRDDKKFNNRRVCFLKSGVSYDVIKFPSALAVSAIKDFKLLLSRLESGANGPLFVKTSLMPQNIREVCSAYEAIRQDEPSFNTPEYSLPDKLWAEYLADKNLEGYDLFHWRSFLKMKLECPENPYLRIVLENASGYDSYKKRIFSALLEVPHNEKRFAEVYGSRKKLLKDVKDSDIAEYVADTKVKDSDRIYYLTDNTALERQAIIECLNGMSAVPNAVKDIYPALYEYLHNFSFSGDKGELFTDYFAEYKRLKLTNRLTSEFFSQVCDLAVDGNRPYNSLKTRGYVLDSISKANAALYWIDALGVEYLGYIQSRANALGLKITVHVVQANLPSITSLNRDFYDVWSGIKAQTKELDKIKHEGERDFNYQTVKTPIHLAAELQIIDEGLEWAKKKLTGKNADKVIVISDHGASRLAVINEQECMWKMASKGKHSGRCCPCNEADVKSEYATKAEGFWVLANYDRFKGGRKASVEVHGGATLEEVVIPLIEIELFDNKIEVSNTTPVTTASFKKNAEIVLFSKNSLKNVSVRVLGKQYVAKVVADKKHKVVFPDIKRAGNYTADVFEGDNLIDQVEFEVQRESGKTNDSDWFN